MNGTAVTNRLQNSFKITCTDLRIIEILELRPSNRLPVTYYHKELADARILYILDTIFCPLLVFYSNRLQNSFKIKDNNLYGSSYY
jgi:hypothetical protein